MFLLTLSNLNAQDKLILYDPLEGEEDKYLDLIYDNLDNDNEIVAYVALQRLIAPLFKKNKIDAAVSLLEEFKSDFDKYQPHINKIIELLNDKTYSLKEVNLGPSINTESSEYSPVPNADETKLYFTGFERSADNKTEDIFYSEYKNGFWSEAIKIQDGINTDNNMEAPQCITTDENTLIFFGNHDSTMGRGDLFYVERVSDTRWGEVQHYPEPINSIHFDCDAKITNNGNTLIFVSDRPGGIGEFRAYGEYLAGTLHGNTDIYISTKDDFGNWTEPINLGSTINTPYAERKPFLHPDGKTLYFSSNGHPGIGRLDLFMSKRLNEDSWTEWSEPVNFGKEINSPRDERAAIINTFGKLAYFASADRPGTYGRSDIFTMELPPHLRPEPVAVIKGFVKSVAGEPLSADILWEDLTRGKKVGNLRTNPETGEFMMIFPMGKNYGFYADKENYFPISKNIDLTNETESKVITQDITLIPLEQLLGMNLEDDNIEFKGDISKTERKLRINNLFFNYRESEVLSQSYLELDRVVYLLRKYPVIKKVEIGGHTDNVGSDSYNESLSLQRAEEVMEYLIQKGIDPARLVAKGYGESSPVADNDTEEGRGQNRRVELKILEVKR